jgi:hypothetical protein
LSSLTPSRACRRTVEHPFREGRFRRLEGPIRQFLFDAFQHEVPIQHETGVQENEAIDALGSHRGQMDADAASVGEADHVRSLHTHRVQRFEHVLDVLADVQRRIPRRLAVATEIHGDEPPPRQALLGQPPEVRTRAREAVDRENRIGGSRAVEVRMQDHERPPTTGRATP